MREIFPPKASTVSPPEALTVTIPLKLLTPMIGGGVEALTPDPRNPARATAIRGAWRWWWRALQPEMDLGELHRRETLLFGGVGKGDGEIKASLIRVRTRVLGAVEVMPAGVHRMKDDGRLRQDPDWNLSADLKYALFPLMRDSDALRDWGPNGHMPTRSVITTMRFDLDVSVDSRLLKQREDEHAQRQAKDPSAVTQLDPLTEIDGAMEALRWWVHFGGLGGRTRRGFGALALYGDVRAMGADGRVFEPRRWWEVAPVPPQARPNCVAPDNRPSLIGAEVWRGATENEAMAAHGKLVSAMAWFRQGRGFARDPGSKPNQPGESRWPEVTLAKVQVENELGRLPRPFEHPIRTDSDGRKLRPEGAPRAAFGMPLLIRFKRQDGGDAQVDCDLVPGNGGRWPSPVLMRPVQQAGGGVVPTVLVLAGGAQIANSASKYQKISLEFKKHKLKPISTDATGVTGATGEIHRLLKGSNGDAIKAFVTWLKADRGFRKVTS